MTHGAVVAREYGIPAVVSVASAVERIRRGGDPRRRHARVRRAPRGDVKAAAVVMVLVVLQLGATCLWGGPY